MKFIANSGVTKHIVSKGIVLSEFRKVVGEANKCANKICSVDIQIDEKENSIFYSRQQ